MRLVHFARSHAAPLAVVRFLAACAFLSSGLGACGGEAIDSAAQNATGGTPGGVQSASGGAATSAGGTSGGSGGATSPGGTSGGSGGTRPSDVWWYLCSNWSEIENEPLPGKVGIEACPTFYELELVARDPVYCIWEAEPPEATIPVGTDAPSGDCCYGITYHHCR